MYSASRSFYFENLLTRIRKSSRDKQKIRSITYRKKKLNYRVYFLRLFNIRRLKNRIYFK